VCVVSDQCVAVCKRNSRATPHVHARRTCQLRATRLLIIVFFLFVKNIILYLNSFGQC